MTTEPIVKTTDATRIAGFLPNLQKSRCRWIILYDALYSPLSDPATYKGEEEGKGNSHARDEREPQSCLVWIETLISSEKTKFPPESFSPQKSTSLSMRGMAPAMTPVS